MALNARSKRRSAFGKNPQAKMTKEQYHELIGRHKHVEHKALRQEVAKEFESYTQNTKPSATVIQSGQNIFNPSQPPILPMEENEGRNQKFVKSQTWPKLSTIQRCAQMLYYTLEPDLAREFFEKMNIPQAKLEAAYQVYELMIQSTNYWRKLQNVDTKNGRKYTPRYNSVTRKYALQKAPWTLQLAMTLTDFHLDHIVDIVYLKPLWSADYDEECEKRQQQHTMRAPEWADQETESETESEQESGHDSEEQPIAELLFSKQKERENEQKMQQQLKENEDYVNKVADHMSREQLDAIKEKLQKQMSTTVEDLFSNIFKDNSNVAFASNFEVNLDDDDSQVTEEIADTESEYEEVEVASDEIQIDPKLKQLYEKYPNLDQNIIQQAFIQEKESYDATVFQLDCMAGDDVTNQFHESQSGK